MWDTSSQIVGQECPKQYRFLAAIGLSFPLELDGRTLLLQTPHTLVPGCGDTMLVLTWKYFPVDWLSQSWKVLWWLLGETSHQQLYPAVSPVSYK